MRCAAFIVGALFKFCVCSLCQSYSVKLVLAVNLLAADAVRVYQVGLCHLGDPVTPELPEGFPLADVVLLRRRALNNGVSNGVGHLCHHLTQQPNIYASLHTR